jgi:oligopeptide/dipeptide ABC transporter ATP-binding protein
LLFAATPDLFGDGGPVVSIPGTPPRLDRPLHGCPFRPRCDRAFGICENVAPPLKTVVPGQAAACHLNDVVEEVRA